MNVSNINVPVNACRTETYDLETDGQLIMTIGRGTVIGSASLNSALSSNVHIGQFCTLGNNVVFSLPVSRDFRNVTFSSDMLVTLLPGTVLNSDNRINGQIIIQNDVWIGDNVTIMGGVKIGCGAVITANSHIDRDVPPYAIVGGNPAVVTGQRFNDQQVADMLDIAWWNRSDSELIDMKPDFAFPIQDFIAKHRAVPARREKQSATGKKRILLFPDFGRADSLWERVMTEYCELSSSCNAIGQLVICVTDDENTSRNIGQLQDVFGRFSEDTGDIVVKVIGSGDDAELFAEADLYVTTKEKYTVKHSCLADLYGVGIISGADMPDVFGELFKK